MLFKLDHLKNISLLLKSTLLLSKWSISVCFTVIQIISCVLVFMHTGLPNLDMVAQSIVFKHYPATAKKATTILWLFGNFGASEENLLIWLFLGVNCAKKHYKVIRRNYAWKHPFQAFQLICDYFKLEPSFKNLSDLCDPFIVICTESFGNPACMCSAMTFNMYIRYQFKCKISIASVNQIKYWNNLETSVSVCVYFSTV